MTLTFQSLIKEFDALYKRKSPLRYEKLNQGYAFVDIDPIKEKLNVDYLPQEYIELYRWKNGMEQSSCWWKDEFKEDCYHPYIPLGGNRHFVSLKNAIAAVNMWCRIKKEKETLKEPCYWKNGFVPLLEIDYYAWVVMDTVGYFNGKKGQLIYFDYKCANGYVVEHEDLFKWLRTNLELLKNDLFYNPSTFDEFEKEHAIIKLINHAYTRHFPGYIPLTEVDRD